jgi:hypothetical protein
MSSDELLTTNRKALTINLDEAKYGTFAEIGAGQEVARHFFQAGGAAGTVAKSISAYDMKFSDAIYGKAARYVSRERLALMLEHEYGLLVERLEALRGERSAFFVFADTVAARNYQGTNECHGWLGIRFQDAPGTAPSDIILHVRMWDKENLLQQQALGIIGVNLIYGAFYYLNDQERFIGALADNLGLEIRLCCLGYFSLFFGFLWACKLNFIRNDLDIFALYPVFIGVVLNGKLPCHQNRRSFFDILLRPFTELPPRGQFYPRWFSFFLTILQRSLCKSHGETRDRYTL